MHAILAGLAFFVLAAIGVGVWMINVSLSIHRSDHAAQRRNVAIRDSVRRAHLS